MIYTNFRHVCEIPKSPVTFPKHAYDFITLFFVYFVYYGLCRKRPIIHVLLKAPVVNAAK